MVFKNILGYNVVPGLHLLVVKKCSSAFVALSRPIYEMDSFTNNHCLCPYGSGEIVIVFVFRGL